MRDFTIARPEPTEYLAYYDKYVAHVPAGNILGTMSDQLNESLALLRSIPAEREGFRYAPDKWSVKELVGHLIDSERIFAYRALRFARNDQTPLPGYEQDDYIANGSFDLCSLGELAAEFKSVRRSTLYLFKHLDEAAWTRTGMANEGLASVRALAYIIVGHEMHHRQILQDRYLQARQDS